MSARIFISYARSDGSEAAEGLIHFLQSHGHSAWQDLRQLGPEESIWPQIELALRGAEFLLILVTTEALKSVYIRKEWREARRNGVTIIPVRAMDQSRSTLPRWLRRGEIFDLTGPAHREKFLARLNSSGGTFRADWDDGLRIETSIARQKLFGEIKARLLSEDSEPVSLASALHGRGGYGKSVLAGEIARDYEIRDAYIDGVFWISLGRENPNVLGQINYLIRRISGASDSPDINVAAEELRRLLDKRDVLIIVDDVWRRNDLAPFAKATSHGAATLLATTRNSDALPPSSKTINVSGMAPDEAVQLLSLNLTPNEIERRALAGFAAAFWCWPQLLAIVNGLLRWRIRDGDTLARALASIAQGASQGVVPGADERDRTVANVMQMGIDDLPDLDRARFAALAVLPEDTAVPLALIAPLWRMSQYEAEEFARALVDRRLIQSRDLSDQSVGARIRMHDDMLWYLGTTQSIEAKQAMHAALLTSHQPSSGSWADLDQQAPTYRYFLRHLLWHLQQAGDVNTAATLRRTYSWIEAKLSVLGINTLLGDYSGARPDDPIAKLVGNALARSQLALSRESGQLGFQLYRQLAPLGEPTLAELCAVAESGIPLIKPVAVGLPSSGTPLLGLVAREFEVFGVAVSAGLDDHSVLCVAISANGRRIVSGGANGTLRLWDAESGAAISDPLRGHEGFVWNLAFSPDNQRIISGGRDGALRWWDAESGSALGEPLRWYDGWFLSVAFSVDCRRIVTGGRDGTLRLWEVEADANLSGTAGWRKAWINRVSVSPDGRRFVLTDGDTLQFWDAESGCALGEPLHRHNDSIARVAFLPNGQRIVSGGRDRTPNIWDTSTVNTRGGPLRWNEGWVRSAAFSPDGRRIVTGSVDGTLRLWDADSGAATGGVLSGHEDWVRSVAFSPDGRRIVSGSFDGTLRMWDAFSGEAIGKPLQGHASRIRSVTFSPDARYIISGGDDGSLRFWDSEKLALQHAFSLGAVIHSIATCRTHIAVGDTLGRIHVLRWKNML